MDSFTSVATWLQATGAGFARCERRDRDDVNTEIASRDRSEATSLGQFFFSVV